MQVLSTIKRVIRNEAISPSQAFWNYTCYIFRKVTKKYPEYVRLSNSKLYFNQYTGSAALAFIFNLYDYNNMMLIRSVLRNFPYMPFIDVGANIGSYTLIASELSLKVVAIEPHPNTYKILLKNIKNNDRKNVTAINMAVGNEAEQVYLTNLEENSLNKISSNGTIPVECITLDKIFHEHQLKQAILKIDVEGSELAVIKGLGHSIQDCQLIFVENGNRIEIVDYLKEKGLIGPLNFHVKRGAILNFSHEAVKEDEIFITQAFINELIEYGVISRCEIPFVNSASMFGVL